MGWERRFRAIAQTIAIVVVLFAVTVLAAQTHGFLPTSNVADAFAIAPGSALAFLFTGAAVFAATSRSVFWRAVRNIAALFSITIIVAATQASRYGIARPAIATTASFVLLDVAILAVDSRVRGRAVAPAFASAAGFAGAIAIAGYLFDAPALYHFHEMGSGMSLLTAITLVAASIAIQLARPDVGFARSMVGDDAGGRALRRLLPGVLLVPLVGVALVAASRAHPRWVPDFAACAAVATLFASVWLLFYVARLLAREESYERRLSHLVDTSATPIIDTRIDGTVVRWNPAAERVYGYSANEIVGRSIMLVVPAEERAALARLRAEVIRTRTTAAFEGARVRKDGTRFYASTNVAPIVDDDGCVIGVSAVTYDLTSRRESEEALERTVQRESRFATALQRGSDAARAVSASLVDVEHHGVTGIVREIAAQARAMTSAPITAIGLTPDRSLRETLWIELDDQGREVTTPRMPRFTHLLEDRSDLANGIATPIRFRGNDLGILVVAARPTESLPEEVSVMSQILADRAAAAIEVARAYEREARGRAWIEAVVDQMPEPVALVDIETGRLRRNRAALALTSEPTGERDSLGNPIIADLRTPSGTPVPAEQRPLERVINQRETLHDEEFSVRAANGADVPVVIDGAPVFDASGRLIGGVIVARDISALKQLERLRSEWTSLVAHDLRQPVAVVKLTTESLAATLEYDPRVAAQLARLRRAADALHRMIGDLLQVTVLDSRRLTMNRVRLDLAELVRECVNDLLDAESAARVKVACPIGTVFVEADSIRMRQIVGNLVLNALKFSPTDSEVIVATHAVNDTAELAVTNRGGGIPAEEVPRLFDRFTRSRDARDVPGLGLGLAITKGLVEAHGGTIRVSSVPDRETTFTVSMPLAPLVAVNVFRRDGERSSFH